MRTSEEIKRDLALSNAFMSGEKIFGIKFRHNSHVEFEGTEDGQRLEGWIVSVSPIDPEPIYIVERCDGGGDEEVIESRIKLLLDPHEPN